VVLCDINGLKPVNDRFGHAAGDELIQRVADHLLLTSGGLSDTRVARIGGDEFVLLLAGPDRDEVAELVQRLAAFEVPYAAGLAVGVATETRRPAGGRERDGGRTGTASAGRRRAVPAQSTPGGCARRRCRRP
ncbi:MAG: GGDEF domain-containing protein, partial [Nocardioidaceae bacterium]|nr:GGDEF domain-containing protein [Nocardioidaceae bacterium]